MSKELSVSKIAEFLKDSVEALKTTEYTCCEYALDDDLSLFVGWSGGYGDEIDNSIIQSEDEPDFAINAGIKGNHDYMKTDFDWLNYPYEEKTGEVWDTGMTVSPKEDYEDMAQWYIEQYQEIRKALDNGEVILENKKVEESSEKEEVSFQEIETMMDNAEDYADLYNAASYIKNTDLRIDVENLIGTCEDDEDEIDQAVSIITSDLIDMYINDENVENLKENKKLTESAETLDNSDEEDLATLFYEQAMETGTISGREGTIKDYEFDSLEEVQDWYDENVTDEVYNKAVAVVTKILNNIKYYKDSEGSGLFIELNDNHTLWDIEAPEDYEEDGTLDEVYNDIVSDACAEFQKETGEQLYLLGRSGRHACVSNKFMNAYRYEELKEIQERLEKEVIENANTYLKNGLEESKKLTEKKTDIKTALNELNVSTFNELIEQLEDLYSKGIIDDDQFDTFDEIVSEQKEKCEDYITRREKVTNTDDNDIAGIESDYILSAIQNLIQSLDENKKVTEGKSIKQDFEDYCKDLGIDCNKKSSINKYLGDYAKQINSQEGIKDFDAKMKEAEKELKECLKTKKTEADNIEMKTTAGILEDIKNEINKNCSDYVQAKTVTVDDVTGIKLTRKGNQDLISLFDKIVEVMSAHNISKSDYEIDLKGNDLILAVKNMTVN